MSLEFLDTMRAGLTPPYRRGMETLGLTAGATAADGTTPIAAYAFAAYQKLYDGRRPQSPRYVVAPRVTTTDPVTVRFWFRREPGRSEDGPVDVALPAAWPAGRAVAVPIPGGGADLTDRLRLTRFQPQPPARPAADWEIIALLGNLAKLLWVIGVEHEDLAGRLADVAGQRHPETAHGAGLDLMGSDLGAPRFPPTPHTVDPDTVALYHLDDRPQPPATEVTTVLDDCARYRSTSHPGQNNGGHGGRTGRFAGAFAFGENKTDITIADSPDFALGAAAPFTVEAIIKPDRATTAPGAVIAKRSPLNTTAGVGWALTLGSYRGIDRNLRFSLSDGKSEVELFTDVPLGDGVFHHVAGVLDVRPGAPATGLVLLYVDGVEVARQTLAAPLAALTNTNPILIGFGQEIVNGSASDAQYVGLVDEVRLSRVARTSFHPVVGEGDDHYRRRLRVFGQWVLPTPGALETTLNKVAGPVAGDPHPFVVDENPDPLVMGTLPLRVLPAPLTPGQGIDAGGNKRTTESAAVGTMDDEPDFDIAWLSRHPDQAGLDLGGVEAHRMMQWSVRQALDALVARLASASAGGTLQVLAAYRPGSGDLHAVGRALLLTHDTLGPANLAVHAHAAGFGWVTHTGAGQVHVAQPRADTFRITPLVVGSTVQPPDLVEGQDVGLGLDPDQSTFADSQVTWSITRTGPGDATLGMGPAPTLHGVAAGEVSAHVEVTRRRHTRSGSRTVRVGLAPGSLAPGDAIGRDGRRGVTEAAAAGAPTDDFSELYLQQRDDDQLGRHTNVDYGNDLAHRRMQQATGAALDRLLELLAPGGGTVSVVRAYDPAGPGLLSQGRALWLRHSSLSAAELAAGAFAAAFDHVRIDPGPPPTVQVAVAGGEQIRVDGATEVQVGQAFAATVGPSAGPAHLCVAADGARFYACGPGTGRVTSFTLTADAPTALPQLRLDRTDVVAASPVGIAFAGDHVYVASTVPGANPRPGAVSVLDKLTLAVTASFATGAQPIALAADGNTVFVACAGDRTLRAYDATTNQQVASLTLPDVPRSIAPVPGGTSVYVVLDGARFCRVNRAGLTLAEAPVGTGSGATTAAVTPDGATLYIACPTGDAATDTGTIRAYATATNQQAAVIGGFPPGSRPELLAVDAGQTFLFVGTSGSSPTAGRVHVVTVATSTLLPQVLAPGSTVSGLATSPATAPYQPCLLAASAEAGTVALGDLAPLRRASPRPPTVAAAVALGSGAGEELGWSTVPFSRGQVTLSSQVRPTVTITGSAPGPTLVRASYLRGAHLRPYQFEVRLNATLDPQRSVTVTKDQYDLVMNVLNWFHPIGVEVRTARLRAHVAELGDLDRDLVPGFTFPVYRHAGPTPLSPY